MLINILQIANNTILRPQLGHPQKKSELKVTVS